jgi:hypothetical protein
MNEKFLIKMRDCVLKLSADHPVNHWLKAVAVDEAPSAKDQDTVNFLTEILNSQFNLITDLSVKGKIINHLHGMPESSLGERLLKSYLYLIIGNITRSDNLLTTFIQRPPYENWRGSVLPKSIYHKLGRDYLNQIMIKFSKHPADRRTFQLFCAYLETYFNDENLLRVVSEVKEDLSDKLKLRFVQRIAPDLTRHLNKKFELASFQELAMWHLPFAEFSPALSEKFNQGIVSLEQNNPLWFVYLASDDKIAESYAKITKKAFLTGRRQFLRTQLDSPETFMLALFKLIEFGDIDETLVKKTATILSL